MTKRTVALVMAIYCTQTPAAHDRPILTSMVRATPKANAEKAANNSVPTAAL